jgi:hypothetical protein
LKEDTKEERGIKRRERESEERRVKEDGRERSKDK